MSSPAQPATPPRIGYVPSGPFGLNVTNVDPPMLSYVRRDEVLSVQMWNSVVGVIVTVAYRVLMADGQVIDNSTDFKPTSARALNTFTITMEEGYLLSVIVSTATASVSRGSCFVVIRQGRGNKNGIINPTSLILSDYVTTNIPIGWPSSPARSSVDGAGLIYSAAFSAPGAGNFVTINPPANTKWRLVGIQTTFSTSAAVANRTVQCSITRSGLYALMGASLVQTATKTWTYNFGPGFTQYQDAAGLNVMVPMLSQALMFGTSDTITIQAVNMDVGDNFTPTVCVVEEFLSI